MNTKMNAAQEVHTAFGTVKDMLRDRQVPVGDKLDAVGYAEIKTLVATKPVFVVDAPDTVRIIFHLGNKYKSADVKKLLEEPFPLYILVTRDKLSSVNAKQMTSETKVVDVFDLGELFFNVSRHALVPRHEPVRRLEDIQAVLDRYRLKNKHQLPHILRSDPQARYLGLRPGQLVKITRASPGAGEYVLYRCCV